MHDQPTLFVTFSNAKSWINAHWAIYQHGKLIASGSTHAYNEATVRDELRAKGYPI